MEDSSGFDIGICVHCARDDGGIMPKPQAVIGDPISGGRSSGVDIQQKK